ncbi:MAG: class I tRNA ligase family protein, partial [Halobacteriaceae archaeon]
LQGDDVLFPQGWDCHGLPTEVKVEENHDIHRNDVSREEFRELCVEHTEEMIDDMKETMHALGFSQDWNHEYRTMDPEYWERTQRSFAEMADDGLVYRDEHPVNWCPRCQTAIADAEVEAINREGILHYIEFPGIENEPIEIATTRPELLPACVGIVVDPDDERYEGRIGDTFEVPLFGQEVELFADEAVDMSFGTGAVMTCTFGDKQDVDWWAEHDLNTRIAFTEDGHLNDLADEYEGLSIDEAREKIQRDLNETDHLLKTEHMHTRLKEWTEGMDWDWVISRQRVFATPIPAWRCDACDYWHIAAIDELPVDPTEEPPSMGSCPDCGGKEWIGETDVMDTWMDSSITPLFIAGWPREEFEPVSLRPQGHDIIRTWAFYTLLRTDALVGEKPWETILINGMVFGPDGNKMSKSRGNVVEPDEAIEEYSADAFRQALTIAGRPGSDVQFQWKEMKSAARFNTKLWNVFRFAVGHFDERTPEVTAPAYRDADAWIRHRYAEVIDQVKQHMEDYRFDRALRTLREFVWQDLADDYLELVKGRLYGGRPGERDAARYTLYTIISGVVRLLSPFIPHLTEEMWSHLPDTTGSIHASTWPTAPEVRSD